MGETGNLERVQQVLERNKDEILRRYKAVGVGIGKRENGYVITVYLKSKSDVPTELQTIQGVPVHFEVTGEFRPVAPEKS